MEKDHDEGAGATSPTRAIFEWLVDGAPGSADPKEVLDRMCPWLVAADVPVDRVAAFVRSLHPERMGRSYTWTPTHPTEVVAGTWETFRSPVFLASPVARVFQTGSELRVDVADPAAQAAYEVVRSLAAVGFTDYLVLPLTFGGWQTHAISFATRRPGGFTASHLAALRQVARPLARVAEIHALSRTAEDLLDTYVGHDAGARILAGRIQRGDTEEIRCVLWFSDLRGFTALSDRMAPSALIRTLNEVFDCQVPAIVQRGGEVLKYMGDGMLAIFPVAGDDELPGVVARALDATDAATAALAALNEARGLRGEPALRVGVALHEGQVTYGNIGGAGRLDFTCIGPAVNVSARLEGVASRLGRALVLSEEVARVTARPLVDLGAHDLKGVAGARRVFAPAPLSDRSSP